MFQTSRFPQYVMHFYEAFNYSFNPPPLKILGNSILQGFLLLSEIHNMPPDFPLFSLIVVETLEKYGGYLFIFCKKSF